MWFYKFEQDQKENSVCITWNTYATYVKNILGFGGVGACFFNILWLACICVIALMGMLGYYLYRYGDLIRILRIQEQAHKLTYTGNRYSFKSPLQVTIPMIKRLS